MGLCGPCQDDSHERHQPSRMIEIDRKGFKVKSRAVACECACLIKNPVSLPAQTPPRIGDHYVPEGATYLPRGGFAPWAFPQIKAPQ